MFPFGPSKFEQLLALMREDRAADAAHRLATLDFLKSWAETAKAQQEMTREHFQLLTAPTAPPRVRIMDRPTEALLEQQRKTAARPGTPATQIPLDTLLRDLEREFGQQAKDFD